MESVPPIDIGFLSLVSQRVVPGHFKIDFLSAVAFSSTSKSLRRELWPKLVKHATVFEINSVKITECDNSLYLLFPDIPWQLFGKINQHMNDRGPWFYEEVDFMLCTREMYRDLWRLGKECSSGQQHVCPDDPRGWIRNNEYNHRRIQRSSSFDKKKRKTASVKSKYDHLGLGHSVRLTITNRWLTIPEFDGKRHCQTLFSHHVKSLVTRIGKKRYRAIVPPKILKMRERKHKEDIVKTVYDLSPKSLKCFDVREMITIHHSVLPSELTALLTLTNPAVRSLTYWRISELDSELLTQLKLIFSNLRCLKGFYIPGSPIREIFDEEWHSVTEINTIQVLQDLCSEIHNWERHSYDTSTWESFPDSDIRIPKDPYLDSLSSENLKDYERNFSFSQYYFWISQKKRESILLHWFDVEMMED